LPTGGSVIIIGPQRDLFEVVHNFMDFFIEESCGSCVPCRVGNTLLRRKLEKIIGGKGTLQDLGDIESWGRIVKTMSRCGLGQTSANPILTTLANFRDLYEAKVRRDVDFLPEFDLAASVREACEATGRPVPTEEIHHD
ncbi:MAG: hypothetical protein MUQ00_00285, partial [Candidatus Aminicenantes bacterium]|nr:hypothetical protein [Candidatus Aminicenantes bacterium]